MRHFVQTSTFARIAASAGVNEDEILELEAELRENPRRGALVAHTGGSRKIRVALTGGGKRGGARVLYFYSESRDTIYFLLAYPKNVQGNLTPGQRKLLRDLVARLE
jgi:hypothetical protein